MSATDDRVGDDMTTILVPASRPCAIHRCWVDEPFPLLPIGLTEHPEARQASRRSLGMVVRCDECGQHWRSDGYWWWPITGRRGRRYARAERRRLRQPTTEWEMT